jgi:hypothetical protein
LAVTLAAVIAYVATATPTRSAKDLLALHGRPPHSVELAVTLRTGSSLQATGTLTINALTSAVSGRLEIPITTAPTTIDVRALKDRLYLTSPNLADATGPVWYSEHVSFPALGGFAHYLVRPDAAILTLLAGATPSHHDGTTTYRFERRHVTLGRLGATHSTALTGELDVRLTLGRQGEVTDVWLSVNSTTQRTSLDLRVLSYNQPAAVAAPPASRSTRSASPLLKELFTSGALGSVVVPATLLHGVSATKVS